MTPLVHIAGVAATYLEANVDTDVIIRIERLTERADLRTYAFEAIRYDEAGAPDPACVFNQPRFRDAPILLAGKNFGCGSSREGAVTAIMALGFQVVIAPSFGEIFYANCFRNGMLPIKLPADVLDILARQAGEGDFAVDLKQQLITSPNGEVVSFEIDVLLKEGLLGGLDEIGLTLKRGGLISDWQDKDRGDRPWIWLSSTDT